jgi:hypothetical protein|tara:strand:+ start:10 stop:150 length:141 start_codon:yes stop_codon:yes gene_type:complete
MIITEIAGNLIIHYRLTTNLSLIQPLPAETKQVFGKYSDKRFLYLV